MKHRTVAFSKDACNLFFHILTQCNLCCAHCYINKKEHGHSRLDLSTIKKWLAIFKTKASKTNLVILGGEPTLHPDLDQVVLSAREMGFKSITVDTNGYLFHDVVDKINPADLDFLSFSLDGATAKTNDAIRGEGCYTTVLAGIRKAAAKGFSCSMIYTVSDQNIHELERMPDLLQNLGIQRFFIQVIGMRGNSAIPEKPNFQRSETIQHGTQVNKSAWLEMIPRVAQEIARLNIPVIYPKVFLETNEPFECAGNVADNYFIFPNGRVYQCPICEDLALHSFEIRENRLVPTPRINEKDLFGLCIPEGCVMNKLIQPENLAYDPSGRPLHKIACCLLKEEVCLT